VLSCVFSMIKDLPAAITSSQVTSWNLLLTTPVTFGAGIWRQLFQTKAKRSILLQPYL
jgi:hypothetical protein